MGPGASDISEVVPELLLKIEGLRPPPPLGPEQARFRLFSSITTFLKNASRNQPLVLVLEDLHWADRSSLFLLEFLGREIGSTPLLLLGTYRSSEVTGQSALTETLGTLVSQDHFSRVQLDGLSRKEVGELVLSKSGVEVSADAVAALHRRTEGNPLFVGEVVGSVSQEQLAGDSAWVYQIPEAVRDAIAGRMIRLSEPCAALLDIASVIGGDFDYALLRALNTGIPENVFIEALDEALVIRMVEVLPEGLDRYRFTHALIQQAVYEKIPAARRLQSHAAVGEALERLHLSNLGQHAAELAYHFTEARAVTGEAKAVEYSLVAGEKALESFAYEQAMLHFNRVLDSKEGQTVDDETAQALFGLGRAQSATLPRDQLMEAHRNLRRAFDYYASVGSTDRIVAIAEMPILPLTEHGISTSSLVERALELVPAGSTGLGRLHAYYGQVLGLERGDYSGARASFDQALKIARRDGNQGLEMRTLNYAAQVELWHHKIEESLASSLRAIQLAAATSDPRGEVNGRYLASLSARGLGNIEEAQRQASAVLEPAERLRDRYWLATAHNTIAWPLLVRGEWQLAREANQRGLDFMPLDPRILLQRVLLEAQNGDRDETEIHLERLEDVAWRSSAGPTTANATLAFASAVARSIFGDVGRPNLGESSINSILSAPSATPFFASWARIGAALLAVMNKDSGAAGEHYAALKHITGAAVLTVNVERVKGLLAETTGDLDAAISHFQNASEFCRETGHRPELAWSSRDYAAALMQRRGPDDQRKAVPVLAESVSIATELGMAPLVASALALQAQLVPGPETGPDYPGGLTQREVEVLTLLAQGRTNREIATNLVLSERTVQRHISNIYTKINARNRAEATTFALSNLFS
jgi:DNA-binding CsgD family transcriptional regulator/tetratricopeptide (TPR) repeat protein